LSKYFLRDSKVGRKRRMTDHKTQPLYVSFTSIQNDSPPKSEHTPDACPGGSVLPGGLAQQKTRSSDQVSIGSIASAIPSSEGSGKKRLDRGRRGQFGLKRTLRTLSGNAKKDLRVRLTSSLRPLIKPYGRFPRRRLLARHHRL
jgi:hypothetical protein